MTAFFIFSQTSLASAASPWTEGTSYTEKITEKFEFGLKNFLGGWTEIYNRPKNAHATGGNLVAATLEGVSYGLIDTVGGVVHLTTFLIPVDIPLPENGAQIPGDNVKEEPIAPTPQEG